MADQRGNDRALTTAGAEAATPICHLTSKQLEEGEGEGRKGQKIGPTLKEKRVVDTLPGHVAVIFPPP